MASATLRSSGASRARCRERRCRPELAPQAVLSHDSRPFGMHLMLVPRVCVDVCVDVVVRQILLHIEMRTTVSKELKSFFSCTTAIGLLLPQSTIPIMRKPRIYY
ncbi:TPA: hypothetical protein N0F65_008648, partial [Lagenidium giganteum]